MHTSRLARLEADIRVDLSKPLCRDYFDQIGTYVLSVLNSGRGSSSPRTAAAVVVSIPLILLFAP